MQTKYISYSSNNRSSLLRKAGAVVATVAMVGLALMFSAVLLAVILIVGTIAWAYLWWKTRELRKLLQAQMQDFQTRSSTMQGDMSDGEVIEGEVVHVDVSQFGNRH